MGTRFEKYTKIYKDITSPINHPRFLHGDKLLHQKWTFNMPPKLHGNGHSWLVVFLALGYVQLSSCLAGSICFWELHCVEDWTTHPKKEHDGRNCSLGHGCRASDWGGSNPAKNHHLDVSGLHHWLNDFHVFSPSKETCYCYNKWEPPDFIYPTTGDEQEPSLHRWEDHLTGYDRRSGTAAVCRMPALWGADTTDLWRPVRVFVLLQEQDPGDHLTTGWLCKNHDSNINVHTRWSTMPQSHTMSLVFASEERTVKMIHIRADGCVRIERTSSTCCSRSPMPTRCPTRCRRCRTSVHFTAASLHDQKSQAWATKRMA